MKEMISDKMTKEKDGITRKKTTAFV